MKKLLFIHLLVLSALCFGEETKHQIMFSSLSSPAWNGSTSSAKFDSSLNIDDYSSGDGNFAINYMYTIAPQLQLGFVINNKTDSTEVKYDSGKKSKSESRDTALYIIGTYNMNPKINESWYIAIGFGHETFSSESESTSGSKTDRDSTINATVFSFGKRFPLTNLGIQNLTWSPMVSYLIGKTGGDMKDDGIKEISGLTIDVLKLDLLF